MFRQIHFERLSAGLLMLLSLVGFSAVAHEVMGEGAPTSQPATQPTMQPARNAMTQPNDQPAMDGELPLDQLELSLHFDADFSKPLNVVEEQSLFDNKKDRVKLPGDALWVYEGRGSAHTEDGKLVIDNRYGNEKEKAYHCVLWNTMQMPGDFLLSFTIEPSDPGKGLNIIFFSAKARDGSSIFAKDQPYRGGNFKTYHSGEIDCYHTSYWATYPSGQPRGAANMRKNHGFELVADGKDLMAEQGPGPHRVRLLKVDGEITLEVNGKIALTYHDDGKAHGPVLKDGLIGLRQMRHTGVASYSRFTVWQVQKP